MMSIKRVVSGFIAILHEMFDSCLFAASFLDKQNFTVGDDRLFAMQHVLRMKSEKFLFDGGGTEDLLPFII